MPYVLTDGKSYIMKNPFDQTKYLSTTYVHEAAQMTYKQARSLLHSKKQKLSWIRTKGFYMLDVENNSKIKHPQLSNKDVFNGNNSIDFDEKILDEIENETINILSLNAWSINELNIYHAKLTQALSYHDSGISDLCHVIEMSNPPADVRTILYGKLQKARTLHTKIKQQLRYVEVMQKSINEAWTLSKLKEELSKVKHKAYKGRTNYYYEAMKIIEDRKKK